MINISLPEIFTQTNINSAFEKLKTRPNSCGTDGQMLYNLDPSLKGNGILRKLVKGDYRPRSVLAKHIATNNGKERVVYSLCSIDKLVTKTLQSVLAPAWDNLFIQNTLAYRIGKGVDASADILREAVNRGLTLVVKIDIKNFYDTVDHEILLNKLTELGVDMQVKNLINSYFNCTIEDNDSERILCCGLIQGNPLSTLLSNIYLIDFDKAIFDRFGSTFYRYSDDIAVFCSTAEDAKTVFDFCRDYIETKCKMKLNEDKCGIVSLFAQPFLGLKVEMNERTGTYEIIKRKKNRSINYEWRRSTVKCPDENYEILSDGALHQKAGALHYTGSGVDITLPIKTIKNINCFSNVSINGNILTYLHDNGISLTVFNKFGNVVGRFVPENCSAYADTFLNQVKKYTDDRMRVKIAGMFAEAEIFNLRANIKYYAKHRKSRLISQTDVVLGEIIKEIKKETDYDKLLLTEARGRNAYYECLNDILPDDDFLFVKRTRQPPEDAINSLISFGNVVLYNHIANEIRKTSMNVKIGYLHATNSRAESLNLDIAEIFKPVIIDRMIFSLINMHYISEALHFEKDGNKVWLNAEGKKIFMRAFYEKMRSEITVDDKKMSYRQVIMNEIHAFQRFINDEEKYKPFHYRV